MIPLLFPKITYARRRERLLASFEPNRDLLIVFSGSEKVRSHDTHFPYRPDSNFLYLCGYEEPNAVLFIWKEQKNNKKSRPRTHLLVLPKDPFREQWDGRRFGPERAKNLTGVDGAGVEKEFENFLLDWLENVPPKGVAPRLYANTRFDSNATQKLQRAIEKYQPSFRRGRLSIEYVAELFERVSRLRLVKDNEELKIMRRSAEIAVRAHTEVLQALRPGLWEYEIQALVEYVAAKNGARHPAYGSICASGDNATILHYIENNRRMREGDLFLIDAGCEYRHYASDITRTYPVGGRYNKAQRNIMDVVKEAHQEAVSVAVKGRRFMEVHQAATRALEAGLKSLKLLRKESYQRYFPHSTSHWLGMDVHDPCPMHDDNFQSMRLEPGMVFTIEPGLYFLPDDKTVPQEYRGIGVRIEDDVVITAGKPEILTEGLPRFADEIEKFMARRKTK